MTASPAPSALSNSRESPEALQKPAGSRRGRRKSGVIETSCDTASKFPRLADADEDLARRAGGLADARRMRDAIVLVLALLGELDDLMPDEPDRSAFQEIAGLFEDVAEFAVCGASAAMRAAGREHI